MRDTTLWVLHLLHSPLFRRACLSFSTCSAKGLLFFITTPIARGESWSNIYLESEMHSTQSKFSHIGYPSPMFYFSPFCDWNLARKTSQRWELGVLVTCWGHVHRKGLIGAQSVGNFWAKVIVPCSTSQRTAISFHSSSQTATAQRWLGILLCFTETFYSVNAAFNPSPQHQAFPI